MGASGAFLNGAIRVEGAWICSLGADWASVVRPRRAEPSRGCVDLRLRRRLGGLCSSSAVVLPVGVRILTPSVRVIDITVTNITRFFVNSTSACD